MCFAFLCMQNNQCVCSGVNLQIDDNIPNSYGRTRKIVVKYVLESSQCLRVYGGCTVLSLNVKGGMPYDDIGCVNVRNCTVPVNCNGSCPVSGKVKRRSKKRTAPFTLRK